MAVYVPAVSWETALDICHIVKSETKNGFTCYIIEVRISPYKWKVERRYRQFVELHEKIAKQYTISKNLLPPKKLLGNRSESFILERQRALEHYLQTLIHQFNLLPEPLALFLDFQKYEIRNITVDLSEKLFTDGDEIIKKAEPFEFTPVQLHAITERLKLGDPTCYSSNQKQDIAHLIEFMTQLKHLKIIGSAQYFEASNIIPNNLSYDLSMFKLAETLEVRNCKLENNLTSVDSFRTTIQTLKIHHSIMDLSHILLCEILHWCPIMDHVQHWPYWHCVTYANFSHNSLKEIHPCIKLLSSLKQVDLSYNDIRIIENMETLSELSILILSHNQIQDLDSLHTRLGNIDYLNLSSNKVKYLHGLSKLFSVSELFLENNLISSISEIVHLQNLPCLEILNLQNNPVTFTIDYRPQVLLMLGSLAPYITFDGLKATEKEIDTVSVLQALQQARGEPISAQKPNCISKETCSELNSSMNQAGLSFSTAASNEQFNKKDYRTKNKSNASCETSKFRQQVETLRKIGGSDWLRLLNEMHCPSFKVSSNQTFENSSKIDAAQNDYQYHTVLPFDGISSQLAPESIKMYTSSFEISYPEWLMFLDSNNHDFKSRLTSFLKSCNQSDIGKFSPSMVTDAKVLWIIVIEHYESSMQEIPVCAMMLQTQIVFLKLTNFTKCMLPNEMTSVIKLYPEFAYIRSIMPQDMLTFSFGPCNAYIELKIKVGIQLENLTVIGTTKDTATIFVAECQRLYGIKFLHKLNPFSNNVLDINKINKDLSLKSIYVEKQIVFSQRVCVSKTLHKCQNGILHYIFVTPSHVVLVEERLHSPPIVELDLITEPQFQICAIVSVHTNIKQIHLEDIDHEMNYDQCPDTSFSEHGRQTFESMQANEEINILYRCGSWLILEFESSVLLYLNFFTLKQRTEFLDAFLSVRNQR